MDPFWRPSKGGAGRGVSKTAAAAAEWDSSRRTLTGSSIRMPPWALPGPEAILAGKSPYGKGIGGNCS
nr:unnamed protein product [Digitaria exilis]